MLQQVFFSSWSFYWNFRSDCLDAVSVISISIRIFVPHSHLNASVRAVQWSVAAGMSVPKTFLHEWKSLNNIYPNVAIYLETKNTNNVELCVMLVLTELYAFTAFCRWLALFQYHNSKELKYSSLSLFFSFFFSFSLSVCLFLIRFKLNMAIQGDPKWRRMQPVPNSPHGLCGRKATLKKTHVDPNT